MNSALNERAPATERRRRRRTPFRRARRVGERISALGVKVDLVRPEEVMLYIAHRTRLRMQRGHADSVWAQAAA